LQANQDECIDAMVVLDNLMGQSRNGATDIVCAKQFLLTQNGHRHSFAASQGEHLKALFGEV
jgi:hypothetical protein